MNYLRRKDAVLLEKGAQQVSANDTRHLSYLGQNENTYIN